KRLTNDNAYLSSAQVAGEAKKLFFSSNRSSGVFHVWALDLAGGDLKQITSGEGETFGSVTADGKSVFYGSVKGPGVWRMSADGGNPVQVVSRSGVGSPAVSPDGRYLA